MPVYGQRPLARGCQGEDVAELQLRLAGFQGGMPDGDFGPLTERQVSVFERDVMGRDQPSGQVDAEVFHGIDQFADDWPLDFAQLACPCGVCDGFGQGRFRGHFRVGKPEIEAYHQYEYPGLHRLLLWALRAALLYLQDHDIVLTSGYRCGVRNQQTGRRSTNHHGKAVDFDLVLPPNTDKRDEMHACELARGVIAEHCGAQIGWAVSNRKALEPSHIAPTWLHYDVRCLEPRYLVDEFYCRDLDGLDRRMPITA